MSSHRKPRDRGESRAEPVGRSSATARSAGTAVCRRDGRINRRRLLEAVGKVCHEDDWVAVAVLKPGPRQTPALPSRPPDRQPPSCCTSLERRSPPPTRIAGQRTSPEAPSAWRSGWRSGRPDRRSGRPPSGSALSGTRDSPVVRSAALAVIRARASGAFNWRRRPTSFRVGRGFAAVPENIPSTFRDVGPPRVWNRKPVGCTHWCHVSVPGQRTTGTIEIKPRVLLGQSG